MIRALPPAARRRLLALFVLAWVLRVAVAIEYEARHPLADHPLIDERSYERQALTIARGEPLGDEPFFQEPLYPWGLALVYAAAGPPDEDGGASARQRTAARHAQAFLGALAVGGVFLLTRRFFGSAAASVAGLAAAGSPVLLLMPALLLKPNLFLPLLLALALVLCAPSPRRPRPWRWLGAGVLAGAGALLRGNVLVLLPLLVAWPLVRAWRERAGLGRGLSGALAFALGAALVLLPVAWRNHRVAGVWALTTVGAGTNVYGGNNAQNPRGRATELPWVRGIPEFEAQDWRREAERRRGRPTDLAGSSRFWLRETGRSLVRDPLLHLGILWSKLRLSLGAYEVPDNHDLCWDARHLLSLRLARVVPGGFGVWGWLGMAGLVTVLARPADARERAARGLALLALLYLATIVLTVTSMRVRAGLFVLLLPFAGAMAVRLLAFLRWRAGRIGAGAQRLAELLAGERPAPAAPRPGAAGGLALLGGALLAWIPALSAEERAHDLDERDFNLAVALLEEGELEASEALARVLDERHGGTPRVATLVAELDYRRAARLRQERPEALAEREALLDRSLARLRDVVRAPNVAPREAFRARAVAGLAQLEAGDGRAAEGHLRAALAFDPGDRRVRFALANALWMQAGSAAAAEEAALVEQVLALLEGLLAEREEPEVRARLEEVRARRAGWEDR